MNDMDPIMNSMKMKNAQMAKVGSAKVQAPAAGQGVSGLQRIVSDSDANATPKKNAMDINEIAGVVIEHDMAFKAMVPKLDEMYQKVEAIMQALQGAQDGSGAAPQPPQGNIPGQGV